MGPSEQWLTLMRFMAQEIVELAFQQHPELCVDDSKQLFSIIDEHLSNYDMTEVLRTEIKVKLGLG